jgi:hypothetical protein
MMGYAGHINFRLNNPNRFDFNQQSYKHVMNITRGIQFACMAEIGNDPVVIQFAFNNNVGVIVGVGCDFYIPSVNLFLFIYFH